MLSRRELLRRSGYGLGALALAEPLLGLLPRAAAQPAGGDNLLVLCQLRGGLDALSVLAPYQSAVYQAARPTLKLAAANVVSLPDHPELGINRQLQRLADLYLQGELAIVQQVGYPAANLSHRVSRQIYDYGMRNVAGVNGTSGRWYERLRDLYFDQPYALIDTQVFGDPTTYSYPDNTGADISRNTFGAMARLRQGSTPAQQAVLSRYRRIDALGTDLCSRTQGFVSSGAARGPFYWAAACASANLGTRVMVVRYGGFDTHAGQAATYANVLPQLNSEFGQFVDDMQALNLWDRTCVLFFSEFGRRNDENASGGTDHGHGGHMLLAGPHVAAGVHGPIPDSADLAAERLSNRVDFRAVLCPVVRDWLKLNPDPVFRLAGEGFDESLGSELFE
jgi:uncharacterized protein (DUF1501 family)